MVVAATCSGLFGGDSAQHGLAPAPFDHRDLLPRVREESHHEVNFPIADAPFFLDDGRSLVHADAVFNLPSAFQQRFLRFF